MYVGKLQPAHRTELSSYDSRLESRQTDTQTDNCNKQVTTNDYELQVPRTANMSTVTSVPCRTKRPIHGASAPTAKSLCDDSTRYPRPRNVCLL